MKTLFKKTLLISFLLTLILFCPLRPAQAQNAPVASFGFADFPSLIHWNDTPDALFNKLSALSEFKCERTDIERLNMARIDCDRKGVPRVRIEASYKDDVFITISMIETYKQTPPEMLRQYFDEGWGRARVINCEKDVPQALSTLYDPYELKELCVTADTGFAFVGTKSNNFGFGDSVTLTLNLHNLSYLKNPLGAGAQEETVPTPTMLAVAQPEQVAGPSAGTLEMSDFEKMIRWDSMTSERLSQEISAYSGWTCDVSGVNAYACVNQEDPALERVIMMAGTANKALGVAIYLMEVDAEHIENVYQSVYDQMGLSNRAPYASPKMDVSNYVVSDLRASADTVYLLGISPATNSGDSPILSLSLTCRSSADANGGHVVDSVPPTVEPVQVEPVQETATPQGPSPLEIALLKTISAFETMQAPPVIVEPTFTATPEPVLLAPKNVSGSLLFDFSGLIDWNGSIEEHQDRLSAYTGYSCTLSKDDAGNDKLTCSTITNDEYKTFIIVTVYFKANAAHQILPIEARLYHLYYGATPDQIDRIYQRDSGITAFDRFPSCSQAELDAAIAENISFPGAYTQLRCANDRLHEFFGYTYKSNDGQDVVAMLYTLFNRNLLTNPALAAKSADSPADPATDISQLRAREQAIQATLTALANMEQNAPPTPVAPAQQQQNAESIPPAAPVNPVPSMRYDATLDENFLDSGWTTLLLNGNPGLSYIFPKRGRVTFDLPAYYTHIIQYRDAINSPDVKVEAVFENVNVGDGAYTVMCRVTDNTWYELRVHLTGPDASSFKLMKYDRALKAQGRNPYTNVHHGMDRFMTENINLRMNARNKLGLICVGDTLRVFINDVEQKQLNKTSFSDGELREGGVGFGVIDLSAGATKVDLLSFSAESVAN